MTEPEYFRKLTQEETDKWVKPYESLFKIGVSSFVSSDFVMMIRLVNDTFLTAYKNCEIPYRIIAMSAEPVSEFFTGLCFFTDCQEIVLDWPIKEKYTSMGVSNNVFLDSVKQIVVDFHNTKAEESDFIHSPKITKDNVYIVWSVKVLQNNKALAATDLPDGIYYEIIYNGNKDETYVDVYKKQENYVVKS